MKTSQLRQRTAQLLTVDPGGDRLSKAVDLFLMVLICLNVIAVILESVASIDKDFHGWFDLFELVSVIIFSLEYGLRVWSCPDIKNTPFASPVKGRLRYMLTPLAIIDLLAIIPFYLALMAGLDLRFLRVFRILRVFKLTRYSGAMNILLTVLREEANSFFAAFFVLAMLLLLTSSGIYLIEREVQPEAFGSIPAAMWWAMATLTTVGYGDVTPITTLGKFFGGCITIIGVGMVALPAGILASAFSEQLNLRRQAYHKKLEETLRDGAISQKEAQELAQLREDLDISEEEASLYETEVRSQHAIHCPHCHHALHINLDRLK